MTSALVLCRTPFQACLIPEVLRAEKVDDYELLYLTHQDSDEDVFYFKMLAVAASRADYAFVRPRRFDILTHLDFCFRAASFAKELNRDIVIVGSFDNVVFNRIVRKQKNSTLVTIDDGTGNIFPNSTYRSGRYGGRVDFYRHLFGASSLDETKKRIDRHYTIFHDFENIVPGGKLHHVSLFNGQIQSNEPGPVFFIGAPFNEVLSQKQIERMTTFLASEKIDYYVRHPREMEPLKIGAPMLEKRGLIAEEAILRLSGSKKPTIIALNSSVLFSIGYAQANKTMLIFPEDEDKEIVKIGLIAGCSIQRVSA